MRLHLTHRGLHGEVDLKRHHLVRQSDLFRTSITTDPTVQGARAGCFLAA